MKTTKAKIWRNTCKKILKEVVDQFVGLLLMIAIFIVVAIVTVVLAGIPYCIGNLVSKIFVSGTIGENSIDFGPIIMACFDSSDSINSLCGIIAVISTIALAIIIAIVYNVIKFIKETYQVELLNSSDNGNDNKTD